MNENQKLIFQSIFEKFGTMLLNKQQMAKIVNVSERTLDRYREKGLGCEYKVEGGRVYYPLDRVVSFVSKVNLTY